MSSVTAVILFWLILVSAILVLSRHKMHCTFENQAMLTAEQSLTESQPHHLLALEFSDGALKMKRAARCGDPELQRMH